MSTEKTISKHHFNFTPNTNRGESLYINTNFFHNERDELYYNQELTLMSYCNCATFHLEGATLSPELLRKFADELEQQIEKAKKKL